MDEEKRGAILEGLKADLLGSKGGDFEEARDRAKEAFGEATFTEIEVENLEPDLATALSSADLSSGGEGTTFTAEQMDEFFGW